MMSQIGKSVAGNYLRDKMKNQSGKDDAEELKVEFEESSSFKKVMQRKPLGKKRKQSPSPAPTPTPEITRAFTEMDSS